MIGTFRLAVRVVALCGAVLCGTAGAGRAMAADIVGAGSSFGAPIYGAWARDAKQATGIALNYQSIGSGAGQNQVLARTVDFGASDAPMNAERLRAGRLMQFPTVMGAVVPVVNLPGLGAGQLRLTGPLLAALYAGDITEWNDPRIAAVNPDLTLPDIPVAPVRRADGSGTTFVFTSYLSRMSPAWKRDQGAATSVAWPTGEGARGNDGVAAAVRNTEGAIGYVEYAFAARNGMSMALLRDRNGDFVAAGADGFAAAARSADWSDTTTFTVDLLDAPGAGAWPIMSATYVLIPVDPADPARAGAVLRFFDWAFRNGDAAARALQYVPLPDAVKAGIRHGWSAIRGVTPPA
ncbi:phosphate ABC transporter substrate-binding protein PstS [Gluconacetobacter azotocaptans]|uniref:Phosphate-binding protein PstS n=1 Tax=Gluconacetobacter azotocaptans TaxID=142834 RepID=A0A7W4JS34_9PROT|nr:phosphate ABC transporter substrate-binding protein PstS [Gluconacetobacter azotocaptans]MBB2189864.1 phosphate ABC transporter substrate-binding protein PstS [Gluconacetobacter azotocaptans]MBM9402675.1 phosphate ABC transporter substrate-binding protein PstS [Gluconacetobacter azotocaptans]GBQ29498.1 phosphate-binding periplasmic protein [Gluconacetobacter azotocaptans DSM 13594]